VVIRKCSVFSIRTQKHFEDHESTKNFEPQYYLHFQFDKLQTVLKEMVEAKLKQVEEKQSYNCKVQCCTNSNIISNNSNNISGQLPFIQ